MCAALQISHFRASDGVFHSPRRDEAEMEYLKIAQDLEMYGVNYFTIRVCRSLCEFPVCGWRLNEGRLLKWVPPHPRAVFNSSGEEEGEGLRASFSILGLKLDPR